MWLESCDTPDNTLSGLDIIVPEELKDEVISETEWELVKCFIESLNITWWSEIVNGLAQQVLIVLWEQWRYQHISLDADLIGRLVNWVLELLKDTDIREYFRLFRDDSQSFLVINWETIDFSDQLNVSDFHIDDIRFLFSEWLISKDEAAWMLEWEDGFQEDKNLVIWDDGRERGYNLSDSLTEFWFSENFLISMREITGREMNQQDQERLLLMLRFFLQIESRGWYNIKHDTWASSAEWYLQYVHKNGRLAVVRNDANEVTWYEWLTNSFETWLRKLPDSLLNRYSWLARVEQQSWVYLQMWEWESIDSFESRALQKQNKQSPISLSSQEQLLLTLNDLYIRDSTDEYFTTLFESQNDFDIEKAIIDLYVQEHHAGINTPAWLDDATKRVITQAARDIFWYSDGIVLFSLRPSIRPEGQTEVIRPKQRPDNFHEIVAAARENQE